MIHYHGTPVGGISYEVPKFLKARHALVSFAHPNQIGLVADICQSFVLDNGAFTTWKQGKPLDVKGYIDWVSDWFKHPSFDWALIPDVIDGDEQQNDDLINRWKNTELSNVGVPVWHLHESIERLQNLCVNWKTVALGSSGQWATPGTSDWWTRISQAMDAICDSKGRPSAKLHGLRMLNPDVFTSLPLSSADSANAAINAGSISRFGMYTPPSAAQRAVVIADRIESHNSSPIWVSRPKQKEFFT